MTGGTCGWGTASAILRASEDTLDQVEFYIQL
jgi:hypothetical protein